MQKRSEFGLTLFLLAPFLFVLMIAPYMPSTDEAWQLHAATRLATGLGYTTYWNIPEDLSGIHGDFLIAWPPGYSVMIAFLMKLGLSVFASAKVFKAALILTAAFVWLGVSQQFLRSSFARAAFLAYICSGAVFFSFSPTDLFCWGIMGLLTRLMLIYADSGSVRTLAVASTLLAAMILMRYHSLFLLPVAAMWCFFFPAVGKRGRILMSVGILLPPVVVYLGIALTNITKEGHLSTITEAVVKPGVQWPWLRDLPRVLLLEGFFFEKVLAKLPLGVLPSWRAELEAILGWVALVGFVMILRTQIMDQRKDRRHLAKWLSLCSIALVLFLGFLTVTRYSEADWAPLTEGRYYWMLSPLVLLIVLVSIEDFAIERVQLKWQRIGVGSVLAVGLIAISGYSIYRYQLHSNDALVQKNLMNKVEAISKAENAGHTVVFSDAFVAGLLLHGNFPVYRDLDGKLPSHSRFSNRTTLVWVLDNPDNFAWRSLASMRLDSIGTRALFVWKTFSPGSFSGQIRKTETP